MAVVAAFLRKRQVRVYPYFDDWLLTGHSKEQSHVTLVRDTFHRLGLLLSISKSSLISTQRIEFIGAVLDSVQGKASFPEPRFQAIEQIVKTILQYHTTTVRGCLKLIGHMAACTYVVKHARLRLRPLQVWLTSWYRLA